MTQPRTRLPRDPVERRIAQLTVAQHRHHQYRRMARLEREVAALGDPTAPSASETASLASDVRIAAILEGLAGLEAEIGD
jgi:hypothetical protein